MSKVPQFQRLDQFKVLANFRGRSALMVQLWWIIQDTLFRWSPQFLFGWRRFLLRLFGAQIGENVLIRPTARITYPWKVAIGDHSWIGDEVILYSLGEIQIGAHVVISQRAYICTGNHDYTKLNFAISAEPIEIAAEVWIATDTFIAPGVKIGPGCVVGARSSVFEDLPGGKICFGNPAKPRKNRPTSGA